MKIYALTNKETGTILRKKFYAKASTAKGAFAFLAEHLKPLTEISVFERTGSVIDGVDLIAEQKVRREQKQVAVAKRRVEWEKERALNAIKKAEAELARLRNEAP